MNRRNVLIGLGGVVAGGGALIGTGAFDTVEAQRDVTVETAGDADAFLGLSEAEGASGGMVNEVDGLIEIAIDETGEDGEGINQRASTRFNNLVTITNQGTQTVDTIELGFPEDGGVAIDFGETFSFLVSEDDDEDDFENEGSIVSPGEDGEVSNILTGDNDVPSELEPGDEVTFGLEIDLLEGGNNDDDLPEAEYTLTIEANAED